ncbi:MAG: NHLP bacteriocin system secretion protein [Cyanobacteria bacterium P01_A01_bin.84]
MVTTQPNNQNHNNQNKNNQNKNNLYRKEALQKVASPEQLDLLVRVTNPKRWASLIALGSLVIAGGAWSWFGRIPIIVKGRGVLVYPSQVVPVQASNPGRILKMDVKTGDKVEKGQVIATLDQSELRSQLQLSREKLNQLRLQDQTAQIAQTQRLSSEDAAIAQQRQTLEESLQTVQSLTPVLREKGAEVIKRDRSNLQERLKSLQELEPTLKQRWQERQKLFQEGAVPKDLALQAQQAYLNSKEQINSIKSQLNQLEVRETNAQQEYLSNLNQVNDLKARLKALDSRQATQKERDLIFKGNRNKEIKETERLISQLQLQLQRSSKIVSQHSGTILELTVKPGQELQPGVSIGTISAEKSSEKLVNVTFLPVSEGKTIKPGTELQITPSTVKREEFGGIRAKVTKVSQFPVTKQGVASIVGNPDILPSVITEGPHVAVYTELETDKSTDSGYKWSSSKGPDQKITAGTTSTVRIKVEEKKPIEFVLPILKDWTGLG